MARRSEFDREFPKLEFEYQNITDQRNWLVLSHSASVSMICPSQENNNIKTKKHTISVLRTLTVSAKGLARKNFKQL